MERINVTVSNISAVEFSEANRLIFLRTYIPVSLFGLLFGIIYLAAVGPRPIAYFIPGICIFFLPVMSEYQNRRDYKKFPVEQLVVEYTFDAIGWTTKIGEVQGGCRWFDAAKVRETRHLLLLYNTKRNSDMVPKRCLSEESLSKIRAFYKAGKR